MPAVESSQPVRPLTFLQRHWKAEAAVLAVVLVAALVVAVVIRLSREPCGRGLHQVDDPAVCVGLDLDSAPLRGNDPLAALESMIKAHNATITGGRFKTVVLAENLTSNADLDSTPLGFLENEIKGAITAVSGDHSIVRLVLANFGGGAKYWKEVVDAVVDAASREHIVAVTGIGVSLDNTRRMVAELSRQNIATIGATVTADDMNTAPDRTRVKDFYRVGPTNTDEAHAAANYIAAGGSQRVLLVTDTNEADTYATTLAAALRKQTKIKITNTLPYRSLAKLDGTDRNAYMESVFRGYHADICTAHPDVIYFAGRGVDLHAFITGLATDGACEQLPSVTVLSGDDTATLAGQSLPLHGDIEVGLRYTTFAYPGQWKFFADNPAYPTYQRNYQDFVNRFTALPGFREADLIDGAAMIEYDATEAAVYAAEHDLADNPESVMNYLSQLTCSKQLAGASGFIAFQVATGNQVDKAMPIVALDANGRMRQAGLVWAQGHPLDTSPGCTS